MIHAREAFVVGIGVGIKATDVIRIFEFMINNESGHFTARKFRVGVYGNKLVIPFLFELTFDNTVVKHGGINAFEVFLRGQVNDATFFT